VTITTSKQLAEALGPRFQPFAAMAGACAPLDGGPQEVIVEPWNGLFRAIGPSGVVSLDADPRAAVLALADRLEAEARALRESVKEGP
jgi:hypothetical protein